MVRAELGARLQCGKAFDRRPSGYFDTGEDHHGRDHVELQGLDVARNMDNG